MTATVQDVLKANVVLIGFELLNAPEELDAFRDSIDSEVVQEGVIVAANPSVSAAQGRILRIPKDRISLESSTIRSVVARDYPDQHDLARLAAVTSSAVANTHSGDRRPKAFGFNVDLVFEQDSNNSALNFISERVFSPNLSRKLGWELVGGSGRLIFEENGHRRTVTVEPRFNEETTSKVYLGFNLHVGEQRIPEEEEIVESLNEAWTQARRFVESVDNNANPE